MSLIMIKDFYLKANCLNINWNSTWLLKQNRKARIRSRKLARFASSLLRLSARLRLLRLQQLYIFLLHIIQRFHGLPVFGPQVLEQGQIQLLLQGKQFGVKVELFWKAMVVKKILFGNHILYSTQVNFSDEIWTSHIGQSHGEKVSSDFWGEILTLLLVRAASRFPSDSVSFSSNSACITFCFATLQQR